MAKKYNVKYELIEYISELTWKMLRRSLPFGVAVVQSLSERRALHYPLARSSKPFDRPRLVAYDSDHRI